MNNKIINFEDKNFNKNLLKYKCLILVDFWADWCNPCKLFLPTLKEISLEFNNKLIVAKLNIDKNPIITKKYNICSIPTLILFNNEKILSKKIGILSKGQLTNLINKYLKI